MKFKNLKNKFSKIYIGLHYYAKNGEDVEYFKTIIRINWAVYIIVLFNMHFT